MNWSPFRSILPGLAFAVAIALTAKGVSWAAGGAVSAILCAVLLGMLWRNLVGLGAWAEPGIAFAGTRLLRIGIALIGLRLTWMALAETGFTALAIVVACVAVALIVTIGLGHALGVTLGVRRLLAAGTAICGATAIVALAPVIRAEKSEVGVAIACVVAFGSIAMVAWPWLAGVVFGADAQHAGIFLGASIHDTSQVVGAALIYSAQFQSPDAVAIAGFTKFLRTSGLLILVPAAAMWMGRGERAASGASAGLGRRALPFFVIAFLLLAGVRALGDWLVGDAAWWEQALEVTQRVSEILLLCGLAAVGLGITFAHVRDAGWRTVGLALVAALATGGTALLLLLMY